MGYALFISRSDPFSLPPAGVRGGAARQLRQRVGARRGEGAAAQDRGG